MGDLEKMKTTIMGQISKQFELEGPIDINVDINNFFEGWIASIKARSRNEKIDKILNNDKNEK